MPAAKKEAPERIEIPAWVPPRLRGLYAALAARMGEEEAASQVRRLKRETL